MQLVMAEHKVSVPYIHKLVIGDDCEPVLSKFHPIPLRYYNATIPSISQTNFS